MRATTYRHPKHDEGVANLVAAADRVAAAGKISAVDWIRRCLEAPGDAPGQAGHPTWRAMYDEALAQLTARDRQACPDCRAGCYLDVPCSCARGCTSHPTQRARHDELAQVGAAVAAVYALQQLPLSNVLLYGGGGTFGPWCELVPETVSETAGVRILADSTVQLGVGLAGYEQPVAITDGSTAEWQLVQIPAGSRLAVRSRWFTEVTVEASGPLWAVVP